MNTSPFLALVSRHVCGSKPIRFQAIRPSVARLFFTTTRSNASQYSSPTPSYGSSEMLKRRYQKTPSLTDEQKAERANIIKRMRWSAYGIALCTLAIFGTIAMYPNPRQKKEDQQENASDKTKVAQLDAPPSIADTIESAGKAPEVEQIPTGTSTIPTFPKTIYITSDPPSSTPAAANEGTQKEVEYQLVGLGVRTVSILGIQVYVVGLYIAVSDVAALQERLVHSVADPVATTLVPSEKSQLRELLLDPDRGEEIWNNILKDGHVRTAFRIAPTRNTDFMHLRDGFVRGITARSAHFASARNDTSFQDDTFGAALSDFKQALGGGARRKLPRGEMLLLARDAQGKMTVWNEDKRGHRLKMGEVSDERVGRLLWLNYLAGHNVSSEPARQSVIDGVMEFVERPVGTLATQVV
ncbi:uncharacterized protein Z518_07961 [Rhinocladiella mackenziei CBS 650.93]|uniref:Chalcone isomerase domain-containing protein n=1 Tax=Rhinocladiella mackenziei CBS 650.93 TaxID=1442369 RepID=A0A0D2FJC3_9EURO|nr:uncharacterized protein Z518_07961 [Rhinocladiella mackenziei CBS 650.93]KIX02022.1 hypothetical protein Z518_07961 [Rhinocladiella mackenziei CBS 650.93]